MAVDCNNKRCGKISLNEVNENKKLRSIQAGIPNALHIQSYSKNITRSNVNKTDKLEAMTVQHFPKKRN